MRRKAGKRVLRRRLWRHPGVRRHAEVPLSFSRKCIRRLNTHFQRGGRFLLDAGSGPIAHEEYLEFGTNFERRVCVDLSAEALRVARSKLGARGVYLQADLTNLPIQTGSIDAVTCNHVIYQIPENQQAAVFKELWRVLKPGGVAVIVYGGAIRRCNGAWSGWPGCSPGEAAPKRTACRQLSPRRRAIFRIRCNGSRRKTGPSAIRSSRSA